MKQLRNRFKKYKEPQKIKELGIYPYFRTICSDQDTEVLMDGRKVLMFGSNSYLGLTNHPKVIEAGIEALKKYGSGCAGSPFLNGTLDIHIELEEKLAAFVGKEKAIVFSTGFHSNIGVIPTIVGRGDHLILDELDHASIIEGRRISYAKNYKFKHNDMNSLEDILKKIPHDDIKMIAVDGVYSMEGDIVNLPGIKKLAEEYNADIYVDEAHSLGVFGKEGRGICNHFGLTEDVDLIMGTFSKSLAAIGGFIATDSETINYLKHNSRTYIFSASIAPSATASVIAALDVIIQEPERIEHLWDVTNYSLNAFRSLGFEIGKTQSPIIPLYIRDTQKTFMITKELYDDGIFVNPVIPPACSADSTLIRFSLMATHTHAQVDIAIDKLTKVFKKYDVIK
ncbi:MAG: aminotransferase class I/II-fold pyridoxal phosphate-dependent enzyme [Bacteroidales bacterium]|nr:aminotransferase class I/II-fold pyridoxal phosphate-dependent enzyme [Bacteroidales bacterium]MDD4683737.1 aminotransferase class I/II-fold pyridoxal phosphate-dependent enzyme [Bacteroidales bacterium]